jgi:predicted alpha/beta hydrolase
MQSKPFTPRAMPVEISCSDGVILGGDIWTSLSTEPSATVIINPATGVLARYYGRYAAFLARHGFNVLTYDYRGIGRSRPTSLRGCGYRWRHWGERDFDAVLRFAKVRSPDLPLLVVGHSIGGFLPGFSENAQLIDRMLTVGAQYAYWPDYADAHRLQFFLKWHVFMPVVTALLGYFPGRRLGWLEDLPAGVANEWSFRRVRMEWSHPRAVRQQVLRRFAAATAPTLAVAVSDDPFGTVRAVRRALQYYCGAPATGVVLSPADLGVDSIGHFGLFHDRHAADFWLDSLLWLKGGQNPWPDKSFPRACGNAGAGADRPGPDIVRYY